MNSRVKKASGHITMLALLLLCIFAALATAMSSSSILSLKQSDNYRDVNDARLLAESGMSFMLAQLTDVRLPGDTNQISFPANMAGALGRKLNGTANLGGGTVSAVGANVLVPPISIAEGTFSSSFAWTTSPYCRLSVCGMARGVTRTVTMDLKMITKRPAVFDYGLASRGQVRVFGNADIVGVNSPSEASILSATQTVQDALCVDGSADISGDLYTSGDNSRVVVTGNPSIAGSSNPAVYASHVHTNVTAPDFPQTDTTALAALAIHTLQPSDVTKKGTLDNIRIPAGMNPVFSSDMVLNGVVYIEQPNNVQFAGKTTLNGIVATQDAGKPIANCQISFLGSVEAQGVDALPSNDPNFTAVKQQNGTFVVAPGFALTFAGNFSAINGSIAADQLTFTGTAEGTVKGSVIGLKDIPTQVSGNVDIYVDRKNAIQNPAGFLQSIGFEPQIDTYQEAVGG